MTPDVTPRRVHTWLFMVLLTPFGVCSGYAGVTLAYQLSGAGASVAQIAALGALSVLPQTWKFFWAPVVDVTLTQKKWYLIAGTFTAVSIAALGFFPATKAGLAVLSILVFLSSLLSTVLGMAVESLLAYSTPEDSKGRAGGWLQAGNLGGNGIGGGLGLVLAERLHSTWLASTIVGGLCLLCALALLGIPGQVRSELATGNVVSGLKSTGWEIWQLLRQRAGLLALILCVLPIGTSAIPFAAVAGEWRASADTVALINGVLGGVISAIGCILGGWLCDRMNRKGAYLWFGLVQAASAVAMAVFPRSPAMFIVWASIYGFAGGLAFAAYTAFVLECIGRGAAATKYNILASFSNIPIYYMAIVDGRAHDRWNSSAMFYTEAGLAVMSALVFGVLMWFFPVKRGAFKPQSHGGTENLVAGQGGDVGG